MVTVTLPQLTELTTSGGSDATSTRALTGDQLELQASGGSNMSLEVVVSALRVHASGSDVLIRVVQRISGNASGGSDVRYYGDPRDIDVNTSGSADVRRP